MEQQLLLPFRLSELCNAICLNWLALEQLAEHNLLSFMAQPERLLSESEQKEVIFLGALVCAGCDMRMIKQLVSSLQKPYALSHDEVYYHWNNELWTELPEEASSDDEDYIHYFIDCLANEGDVETLHCLKEAIESRLAAMTDEKDQE